MFKQSVENAEAGAKKTRKEINEKHLRLGLFNASIRFALVGYSNRTGFVGETQAATYAQV